MMDRCHSNGNRFGGQCCGAGVILPKHLIDNNETSKNFIIFILQAKNISGYLSNDGPIA